VTQTEQLGLLLRTIGFVAALLVVWRFVYLPSAAEQFRQAIFGLRREMFLFAVDAKIPFDTPAYVHLRTQMNGMIRFAERLTLLRLVLISAMPSARAKEHGKRLDDLLAQVPDEVARLKLKGFRFRGSVEIVSHLLRTSPVVWVPYCAGTAVGAVCWLFGWRPKLDAEAEAMLKSIARPRQQTVAAARFASVKAVEADAYAIGRQQRPSHSRVVAAQAA